MSMRYPDDFVVAVKTAYPNSTRLHELLDTGNVMVGRILDDSQSSGLSLRRILSATTLEELQADARAMQRKQELYEWWIQIYQKTMQS